MDSNRRDVLKLTGAALGSAAVATTGLASGESEATESGYTKHTSLKQKAPITGQELDDAIAAVSPGSPLIGLGQTFVNVQDRYGINAVYQAAHAAHESAWGRSSIAQSKNNLFGWNAFDRCPGRCADSFRSFSACVRQVMSYIDEDYLTPSGTYYVDEYGPTLRGMNVNYASDKGVNTPPGDPEWWCDKIVDIMQQLDAHLDTTGGPGGGTKKQPKLRVGEAVIASEIVNIRTGPSLDDDIQVSYPANTTGVVLDGPERAGGTIVWKVEYDDTGATTGWTPQESLGVYGNAGGDYRFPKDFRVRATDIVNIREKAGNDGPVEFTAKKDTSGYVQQGPVLKDGRIWYEVAYNIGITGWSRASGLTAAPLIDDDAAFVPEGRVRVKHDAAYHTRPGPKTPVVDVLKENTTGYVRAGPIEVKGYTWWFVDFNTGFGGWIAQKHLDEAYLPEITEGARVELVRDAAGHYYAGPEAEVDRVYDRNREGYARKGPKEKGGYSWWKVELNTGETAWFAEKHLAVDSTIFDYDETVEPTVSSSVRASKSEDSEQVAVVDPGTIGRIRVGPERNDGHSWWKVAYPDVTGWVVQENLRSVPEPKDPDGDDPETFAWPVSGEVTSGFNDVRYRGNGPEKHRSIDIGAPTGTPIVAAYPGTVTVVAGGGRGGKKVFVQHDGGYRTEYHHMSEWAVSEGEAVSQGDVIGYVGSSGFSSGAHLHLEVVRNDVNQYIPGKPGDVVGKGEEMPGTYEGL